MHKHIIALLPLIAFILPSCGPKEITNYDTIERTVRRANQKYEQAQTELAPALAVLELPSESAQDTVLKTTILRKNKEWNKKDWFAFSWRRMTTGLQGYKNFPFHTYRDFVEQYRNSLKRSWNQLARIKVVDVNALRNNIDILIKNIDELVELIESHDRYLSESDKMGLILTRPTSRYPSYIEEKIGGI